ncbi:MAG: helix-turn-helix domain-containing protein [Thermaceae bacterium]|nr:helix-turn-helix domain-containing protein [Thermaceae bacterium]
MADKISGDLRVFVVPADLLEADLDIYEKMVYVVLRAHCTPYESTAWPSYPRIARMASISIRKAKEVVQSLASKGLISVRARHKGLARTSNEYTVHNVPAHLLERSELPVASEGDPGDRAGGVVHSVHDPRAQRARPPCTVCTTPVHSVHDPRAQRAPEHNQENITIEHNHRTHTDGVCVEEEICERIRVRTGHEVRPKQIAPLVRQYGADKVLAKVEVIAGLQPLRSPVAALRAALREDWSLSRATSTASREIAASAERDPRYAAFYELFPEG